MVGPKDISWLSPKRRRTTGNLKTITNGTTAASTASNDSATAGTPTARSPPSTPRPVSQPLTPSSAGPGSDGNLFYAYARKGDDLQSRYLLTFASAAVASEWWNVLRAHFPDASRPGPQLFAFQTDDLLAKAWKHPDLHHLKSKWMYISFSDARGASGGGADGGLGGAAQGIIPVQDVQGNLLGGSAHANAELMGQVRREAKGVRNEAHKLEEYFEKMMVAVQRSTEKIAALAERQAGEENGATRNGGAEGDGYFDALTGHFGRVNELLAQNSAHVQDLAKRQTEHEEKLRASVDGLAAKQKSDALDLEHLSVHLDRIQRVMEDVATERNDSARDVQQQQPQPPQPMDLSPLTERLEKVQQAAEQNSALVKALLDEGMRAGDEKSGTPAEQEKVDLTPLTEHLEKIHGAIEQQSAHMQALVGFASGQDDAGGAAAGEAAAPPAPSQAVSLAPLGEHLEQIYNAIEEGNKHAKATSSKTLDFSPLEKHLGALRDHSQQTNTHMQRLLESQTATRAAIEANGGDIDFTAVAESLDAIRESNETNAENIRELLVTQQAVREVEESGQNAIDFTPLTKHLEAMRDATDKSTAQIRGLVESQRASAAKGDKAASPIDLTPLTDRLNRIHATLQKQTEHQRSNDAGGTGDTKFLMSALTSHLSKIQAITESNASHVKTLREKQSASQDKMHIAVSETSEQVRGLLARNAENEARIEAQQAQMRELISGQREMVEVMRELARGVVAGNQGSCGHVVVPPPRKMGRKVVGFVYDAKDGPV